jgi:hypothetical protein
MNKMTKPITENFELILEGNENALAQIMALFQSGELEKILGVPVLGIDTGSARQTAKPPLNRLTQWFDNIFTIGWQTVEELLTTRQLAPAHFAESIQRAKSIDLITDTVNLVVSLNREDAGKVIVNLKVFPTSESPNLPANLKLILLTEGEIFKEVTSRSADQFIQYEFDAEPGDEFVVKLVLGEAEITENFVV